MHSYGFRLRGLLGVAFSPPLQMETMGKNLL